MWSLTLLSVQQDPTCFKLDMTNKTDMEYAFAELAAFIGLVSDACWHSFF
jgi:hypothetical protein